MVTNHSKPSDPRFKDIEGHIFGRLFVDGYAGRNSCLSGYTHYWSCTCSCGVRCTVGHINLRSGHTKSCGCMRKEVTSARTRKHGLTKSRVHGSWSHMKTRCYNSNCKDFPDYGGRGIKVCADWHVFENFLRDMGHPPDNLSLDRIDSDGDYESSNCRWATATQQSRNRRGVRRIAFEGVTLPIPEWAERFGLKLPTLHFRLNNGWTIKQALTSPVRGSNWSKGQRKPKEAARRELRKAVRDGKIEKPIVCEHVGCDNADVQAHHESYRYADALDVRWLCKRHHMEADKEVNRGIQTQDDSSTRTCRDGDV